MMSEQTLDQMREMIDVLDAELVERIGRRFALCRRIADYKKRHAVPMMQTDRVRQVKARAAVLGREHEVRPAFMVALYDLIIDETCRIEDALIAGDPTE